MSRRRPTRNAGSTRWSSRPNERERRNTPSCCTRNSRSSTKMQRITSPESTRGSASSWTSSRAYPCPSFAPDEGGGSPCRHGHENSCKPFQGEQNEPFNPFKSLVTSLLGQQISWLAARSITHKFTRLFFPHLPEKLPPPGSTEPRLETPFPTPHQVLDLPDRTAALRGAGLSGRKVEYVVELAERFADGRLDARKLWAMNDDELMEVGRRARRIRDPGLLFSDLSTPPCDLPSSTCPFSPSNRLLSLYEASVAGQSRCSSSLPRNAPTSSPAAISVSASDLLTHSQTPYP